MARRTARPQPGQTLELPALTRTCPECGGPLWAAYMAQRSVTTLEGTVRLRLQVRRCRRPRCPRHAVPLRPEQEGRYALPEQEFGLDVIALIGTLRHARHRSIPEIHAELIGRGVPLCLRTVSNLLDRYDELLALSLADAERLRRVAAAAGRVILAIDGLQPDVGHEVFWVLRDCLSGETLLARCLLSSTRDDLARLITEVKEALEVPIVGAVSDGQDSIRKAIKRALDGVPHQLCHFHYLREAAKPIYEADRHAKKELKKRARGVRPIERKVEGRDEPEARAIQGYCAAVRGALTDDGRPPLSAPGLVLKGRVEAVVESLDRVEEKRGSRRNLHGYGRCSRAACRRRRRCGPRSRRPTAGCPGPRRSWRTWPGGADRGQGELPWLAGRDGPGRRACRGSEGGVGELPEGDAELLAGVVPLLRRARPAADGQRPGAVVRVASVPRAAFERSEGGVAGLGRPRFGAATGCGGDPAAGRGPRRRPDPVGPGGLAHDSCGPGTASGGTGAGPAVPPRSGRVSPAT